MKKIIKTLILVLVVVLALTVFVACNEEPEPTTAPVCKHTGGTATCTEAAVCELCGESYGEALGHTGGEATCTTLAVCATCGENYGELKAHELEAFGEDLPTCTEDGLSSGVVCSVCGYQERRRFPIPALGHNMADATCTEPSTCTREGCGYTEGEALGHDMVEVEALAPTCTAEGYTAHLGCSRCDLTEGKEAVAINPDAHTLVDVAEQAPTCEAVGYTAHKACACGYTEGKEEIAATGHSFTVAVEELAPTTCENGYTAHNECAVCGTPDENYEVLYASHNFTEESYFYYPAPTCTAGGYLAGTCTECGSSFYLEELAPLGHDVEATCTEGGTCSVCGEAVEALGHTWVDADCDTAKTCSVCGATEGEALGHDMADATCTLPATCKICGVTEGEALGHADEDGDYKCDRCSTKMLPADGEALTITQALAVAKAAGTTYTTQKYYITGIVTNVYNTTYGNLYLKDADGNQICIYGLYTWDKAVRYDKMDYKPVEGDELTVYTVLGMYGTTAQGKDAWMDEVVAHEHDYKAVVTDPGCLTEGYTTHTCSICKDSYVDTKVEALGHTTDAGECERCGLTIGGDAPVVGTLAEFTFGANGSASHVDGNDYGSSKTFTSGTYTLALTGMSKVFGPAYDAKGNSCLKLGTSKVVGSFSFTVPENVTEVVIYVAGYKAATSTNIKINGTSYTVKDASDNGTYTAITIDTTTTKTITFESVTYRCMINTIVFNGTAN